MISASSFIIDGSVGAVDDDDWAVVGSRLPVD